MLSSDKSNMSVSGEVNLSSSKVGLSSSKVILSSGKVGLSSMKVILSKILILKSIVCCVCVMFSSDVSWGMNDEKDEINDKIPTYSVVLLGDSQVWKTQILNQKSNFQFNEEYEVTMEVVFNNVEAQIKQDDSYQNIKLTVFDTPGQEKSKTIIHDYVKQAQAVVFVYDITNKESFNNIQTWIKLAEDNVDKEAVYFLVGNKIDKEDEMAVTTNEAQNFAKKYNMKSFEVSASTGDDISELFEAIANACFNNDTIKKIKNEYTEDHNNKYTKNPTLKVPQKLEDKKKDNQIPPPSKNKRCNCCPCCNKDEDDKKEEIKSPETTLEGLMNNID